MADETATTTTEAPSPQTFKIPVRNAAPEDHEHQGKTFKIPVRGKQFSVSVHQPQAAEPPRDTAQSNLENIEDNPNREGTYAVRINGRVKQVPFSKVPHVAAIAPMMTIGGTTFAKEEDERRYIKDLDAYKDNLRSALPKPNHGFNLNPVYSDADLQTVRDLESRIDREIYGAERWDLKVTAAQPAQNPKPPEPIHEPAWWRRTKKAANVMGDIFLGGSGPTAIPGSSAIIEGTDLDPNVILQKGAAQGDSMALQQLAFQNTINKTFGLPLAAVTDTKGFQSVFDPKSTNSFSRFTTGTVKAIENMTSIESLYALSSIYAMPEGIAKPMGVRFQTDLITSGLSGAAKATVSTVTEDAGEAAEKWGDLFGNALVVVGMHYGHAGTEAVKDRVRTWDFNEASQDLYKKPFVKLTDQQKVDVLYKSMEDADPEFKKKVDAEVKRVSAKNGKSPLRKLIEKKAAGGVDVVPADEPLDAGLGTRVTAERLEAAKRLVRQAMVNKARREAAHHEATQREAAARQEMNRRGEAERAADASAAAVTPEIPVEERRSGQTTRGLKRTTEREKDQRYDPEPTEPAIPVTERRTSGGEMPPEPYPKVVAAEIKVEGIVEQLTGTPFSTKSTAEKRNAASWLETHCPEDWEAFRGTPAYAQYVSDVKNADMADAAVKTWIERHPTGSGEPAAPGADIHAGLAKLILARTNTESSLAADPAAHRDLNDHTLKVTGKSWDSLKPEDRPAALADYLRTKPDGLKAFLTPDLIERIHSGQHIDLANIEATLADRQQAQVLMAERDAIQYQMNVGLAVKLATEAAAKHQAELSGLMTEAQKPEGPQTLKPIVDATAGLTQEAMELGLGPVDSMDDLFRVEKVVKETRNDLRTPKMREFAARMQHVRAVAAEHVARTLAEETAAAFHVDVEGAREKAAKQVIEFTTEAHDQQDAANTLRAGGKQAEADAAQAAALEAQRKADAVVAGAQSVTNPPPPPPAPRTPPKMVVGSATKIITPFNTEGIPAHYVLIPVNTAQMSHNPMSFDYTEGFDQNGQPRNYKINKPAQTRMSAEAAQLNPGLMYSNSLLATDGPPMLALRPDAEGNLTVIHVIGGNFRFGIEERARLLHPEVYDRATADRSNRLSGFGLPADNVVKDELGNQYYLGRLIDEPVTTRIAWARLGMELNRAPMGGLNDAELGMAMARLMTPEDVERLDSIMASLPDFDKNNKPLSVREAMRARSADLAKLMLDTGMISPNELQEFVVQSGDRKGDLSDKAKDLFENMLRAMTVTDVEVLNNASDQVKAKLVRAGISFLRARNGGSNWDLASMNTDAVRLITRAQSISENLSYLLGEKEPKARERGATGSESLIERYLHPERYFDPAGANASLTIDGQPLHGSDVHPGVEALAMALEQTPSEYATMMSNYASKANDRQSGLGFFTEVHPADVFTDQIASKFSDGKGGKLEVIPEDWGRVVGLSDTVKAEIEATRGPLPVEPSVSHETVVTDTAPDSSSVDVALPEGPKTVTDFRRALESHPGLSAEEAVAVGTMMQDILPRALGQSLEHLLGNRRLTIAFGGKEAGGQRGYTEMLEDGRAIIRLCSTADVSTFIHEMAHYVRQYLSPEDQAIANKFVGAKPGEAWTTTQEETFAQAFERYHYDGGIRRGKLEKVFATLARGIQSVYNAVTGKKLAKGTPELEAMFDKWYDWTRTERKPITQRLNVEEIERLAAEAAQTGSVEVPANAKSISSLGRPNEKSKVAYYPDRNAAQEVLNDRRGDIKAWEMYQVRGEAGVYLRAQMKMGKKLFQANLSEMAEYARRAKALEDELKREKDPRRQALLRGQLNHVEDKLRGATFTFGGAPEPKDTSIIQLVHGMSEMPTQNEPTTPAQAATVQRVMGDPTAIALGGQHARPGSVSDGPAADGQGAVRQVHGGAGPANGEHAPVKGSGTSGRTQIAKPKDNPLAKVKAARLEEPTVSRGTPVVDPEKWRGYVEELGLPKGTPPPTIRIASDLRDLLIFPGQPEVADGVVSSLQQYDATILASPAGSGKTFLMSAIASHLLGTGGDKVGLWVTRSQNLIHEADGLKDVARRFGVDVSDLPSNIADMQTGMYAATYAGIRGNKDILTVPWDFVLFDESSEARKWTDSEQGKAVVLLGYAAKKVIYSSATPYSTTLEIGYMHKLGLWPHGGFTGWASQFGLVRTGPNEFSGGSAPRKLAKLRQQLIERGQWQQLHKDMEGTEAHVVLIPQTEDVRAGVRSIRKAFTMARAAFQRNKMSPLIKAAAGHEAIYLKRYLEAAKLPHAIELGKKAIADGWSPVFFTEYRSPAEEGMDFINRLPGDLGRQINAMLPPLPDMVKEMRTAFGDKVGIFAGAANELRAEELEGFQAGDKDALYATYAAGGVGASAHDKVGDKPRFGVFITPPWSSIMLEQATSRTDRYGRMSSVANIFLTTDALPEIKLLGTKVLPRMRALKAAIFGERNESQLSKNLREAVGIPEEMLEYEQGQEYEPEAADFEKTSDEAKFTPITEFEIPSAKKAMNKPMKYKGGGKKLYQPSLEAMGQDEGREIPSYEDLLNLRNKDPKNLVAPGTRDHAEFLRYMFVPVPEKVSARRELADKVARHHYQRAVEVVRNLPEQIPVYRAIKVEGGIDALNRSDLGNYWSDKESGAKPYHGPSTGDTIILKGTADKSQVDLKYTTLARMRVGDQFLESEVNLRKGQMPTDLSYRMEGETEWKPITEKSSVGKKLYQGPRDEDPEEALRRAAVNDAWNDLLGRTKKLPAAQERVLTANEGAIKAIAAEKGRQAHKSGGDAKEAVSRAVKDAELDTLLWWHGVKGKAATKKKFAISTLDMYTKSADLVVEKVCAQVGEAKKGAILKGKMNLTNLIAGNWKGRLSVMAGEIVEGNKLTPSELETMYLVQMGKVESDNPRINKAQTQFRDMMYYVHDRMSEKGVKLTHYDEKGKRIDTPYADFPHDPHYVFRMYNWNEEIAVRDANGVITVTTMAEIANMPTSDKRREELIENWARERNVPLLKATLFFDKSTRGIRLAGNIERSREHDIPGYMLNRHALERYIEQVAQTLAVTEVHGQYREKTDPIIESLPPSVINTVNRQITLDLDPVHLNPENKQWLSTVNAGVVTSKMLLSAPTAAVHIWKGAQITSTRAMVLALMKDLPFTGWREEMKTRAADCGALLDYNAAPWMKNIGVEEGVGSKMLRWNGFRWVVNESRNLIADAGRLNFEKYLYPKLVKDPTNKSVRWMLTDHYGFTDEHIDEIIRDGYGPDDVRKISLGAANFSTGGDRRSELPPAFHATPGDSEEAQRAQTIFRSSQILHQFMIRTLNFTNRVLIHQLVHGDWKTIDPYHHLLRFAVNAGLAGLALSKIRYAKHQLMGSSEADTEKRTWDYIMKHPASGEAFAWMLRNYSLSLGFEPGTAQLTEWATHDPKDKAKIVGQHRVWKSTVGLVVGVAGETADTVATTIGDIEATYEDTGHHKMTPEERRENIRKRLTVAIVPALGAIPALRPKKTPPPSFPSRHRHVTSRLQ